MAAAPGGTKDKAAIFCSDVAAATLQTARDSRESLLQSWVFVPVGIFAVLAVCFAFDKLFRLGSLPFPASVAVLIVLFLGLLLSEWLVGEHRTRRAVALIEVPGLWSLRWINVYFTPSFVLLPLSPPVGIVEVFKIIAVFILGFIAMMIMTAYMTRGVNLMLGSSKRAMTERAEELGNEADEIPMTVTPQTDGTPTPATLSAAVSTVDVTSPEQSPPRVAQRAVELQLQDDQQVQSSRVPSAAPSPPPSPPASAAAAPEKFPATARSKQWAAIVTSRLDLLVYASLFLFVGLPVYYIAGYAMPAHTTFSILTYFAATSPPPRWTRFLHPVLVSSLLTVLGIWALGAIKGDSLYEALGQYRTGTKYLQLWTSSQKLSLPLPGAGDVFGSVLDVSIVALALPMYRYRRELRQHFPAIVLPNVVLSAASLFAYPPLCHAVGISAPRSLAFASRSLTLALAIPATANLGGEASTVAAVAIMSGISGVLFGRRMLALMRIPEDDYVTRGVTLGANSSALATAMLLPLDPRAAALSSLSMSLFGTVTVLFTSIPPISAAVRGLVGL
ncbi:LrgB-like family-domain-containing protein [Microdochium trichocladiopsis]|uniref:LrgB-like family-domain-containing protein n=1 Tax=Microdochium trichocladiopsis TaxID=1682393 RepID=A0A9P9BPF7_9PEZI|nr:LrgB-like family-domain-containing protein [Microdochium trichocladiopsis]KAH7029214.1 LrgB-like family-domain-containing protein [Microdochium trichocladiopsis]